jgi:hypothetical protein
MQHPERLALYFRAAGVPASATVRVHAPYTSPLGTVPIACTIAFTVTSPLFSAAVLGACPWIASRMRVGMPASMPTVLKRSLQRCMGVTFGSVTERLTKTVRDAGVTLEDFGRLANEEVIRLSRKWKIGDCRESRIEREWIDYTDTAETNVMAGRHAPHQRLAGAVGDYIRR